jgi:hypothetical protein
MNEAFLHDYEQLARSIEKIVAEYPPEMRDDLRRYAGEVISARIHQLWRDQLRERLLREEGLLPGS